MHMTMRSTRTTMTQHMRMITPMIMTMTMRVHMTTDMSTTTTIMCMMTLWALSVCGWMETWIWTR